jgi:hypothetical protein
MEFVPWILLSFPLLLFEKAFIRPTDRTDPTVRQVLEGCARVDVIIRIPKLRVIQIIADRTDIFFHRLLLGFMKVSSVYSFFPAGQAPVIMEQDFLL